MGAWGWGGGGEPACHGDRVSVGEDGDLEVDGSGGCTAMLPSGCFFGSSESWASTGSSVVIGVTFFPRTLWPGDGEPRKKFLFFSFPCFLPSPWSPLLSVAAFPLRGCLSLLWPALLTLASAPGAVRMAYIDY
jgi:hypothetical protein